MLKEIKVVSDSVETIPQKLYNIRIIRDKIGMRAVDTQIDTQIGITTCNDFHLAVLAE